MAHFISSGHPLLQHKLSYLRQSSGAVNYRDYERLIREIGTLLAYEVSATLPTSYTTASERGKDWKTGEIIRSCDRPVIVPLLRSGLILAEGVRAVVPTPFLTHLGIYTDQDTGEPVDFFRTFPVTSPIREEMSVDVGNRLFIVCDLFIDRGKTAAKAIDVLHEYGVKYDKIKFLSLIASTQGQDFLNSQGRFSEVDFYCARRDADDDKWLPDFNETNFRLYRTQPYKSSGLN